MDDTKETRRYWKLEEEAIARTLWSTRFGRGYVQTIECMNVANEPTQHSTSCVRLLILRYNTTGQVTYRQNQQH